MKKIVTCLLLTLLVACSQDEPSSTAITSGTAITNVTVVDAINGVRENQTVVFDGDEIVYVGGDAGAPRAVGTIEGKGKYLIPGLWDMHVHLTYDDRFTPTMPAEFLHYGVTSVRDTGGLLRKLLPVVDDMRSADTLAPRVYFSGPLLDGNFVVYDGQSVPEIGVQNVDPKKAGQVVADLKAAGASFIKIYEMVSPNVFRAFVDAAAEHEMPIAAHVPLAMTASEVGGSVGSMEHIRNLELDCASNSRELHDVRKELLKNENAMSGIALRSSLHNLQRTPAIHAFDEERCSRVLSSLTDVIQVPTAGLNTIMLNPMWERADWSEALSRMPESVREEWQDPPGWLPDDRSQWDVTFPKYTMSMIARMKAAGVPIGAGTDTPIGLAIPGYSLLNELEILVEAGLTPLEAIGAATVQPAVFFSILEETGTIDVGKNADMVLLASDPVQDIRNVRDIDLVIAGGIEVPR